MGTGRHAGQPARLMPGWVWFIIVIVILAVVGVITIH